MEFVLENVGIISHAHIKLDGLTVVTGKNNSGKTTVGRALYALISAVENLQKNALADKISYTKITINSIFFRLAKEPMWGFPFVNIKSMDISSLDDIVSHIEQLIHTTNDTPEKLLEERLPKGNQRESRRRKKQEFSSEDKDKIVKSLKKLKVAISKDQDLTEYVNKRIEQKLNIEFFNQIAPLTRKDFRKTVFLLKDDKKEFFNVTIDSSERKSKQYFECPFGDALFVDDGSIVDELTEFHTRLNYPMHFELFMDDKDFLDSFRLDSHKNDLAQKLLAKQNTITGELIAEEQASTIFEKIREAVSFSMEWQDGRYVSSDFKIDLRNIAQGSKAFLVIKALLENGTLHKDSLLIWDEPETRLHPEWQSLFAEVIVLLVKHLGCSVLLTTHSPDFVIALDTASREHDIRTKTNFYISKKQDDGLVVFDEVNGKSITMNNVYLHLSKTFMALEAKRLDLNQKELESEDAD